MKPVIKTLEMFINSSKDPRFQMFIRHIGAHIDEDSLLTEEYDEELVNQINNIDHNLLDDRKLTNDLAHEIARWINKLPQEVKQRYSIKAVEAA